MSSVSPDKSERVTSEQPSDATKVRTDNEVRCWLGLDPPGHRALTVTASSCRGCRPDTSGETMEAGRM